MEQKPWLKHYDDGVPHTILYPPISLVDLFQETVRKFPENPCTIFKGAILSYREMDEITDRFAAALAGMGIKKGDRVGILIPNCPQFIMAYFGVLKAGGIVVTINTLYTAPEIAYQLNDAGAEVLIVMSNFYQCAKTVQEKSKLKTLIVTNIKETLPPALRVLFTLVKEKKGGFRVTLASGDFWMQDLLARYTPADKPKVEVGPDDIAIFQYSGGTTGVSKAAISSHRNVVANALQIISWIPTLEHGKETLLMAIPLFHVYGMVAGMHYAIGMGASLVLVPNPRDMHDLLTNIKKYRPTLYPGIPAMYNALNNHPDVLAGKYDLSSIKACISGSAPLLKDTKEKFEALTGGVVFEGYGMSETPTATHCNPYKGENKTGSVGLPLPDVDARIVSLEDGVSDVPVGEIGEIIVNAPQMMQGYHNMPDETAISLRKMKDGKTWLFTGDIGRMDEEGYFYIVDRKKELIKVSGEQVWPREVEEVIITHPSVFEAGVAGVPDEMRGEVVKAWVVVKPGATLCEDDVKEWCKKSLAKFKVPRFVEFRKELPKTTVGKTLRRELVRQHRETQAGG